MALRDEVARGNPAFAEVSELIRTLDGLGEKQLSALMTALLQDDKQRAAQLLGTTAEAFENKFKLLKQHAAQFASTHPEFLNPSKGFCR